MARRISLGGVLNLGVVALAGVLGACGGSPEDSLDVDRSAAGLRLSATPIPMLVHTTKGPISEDGFVWLGPTENLGGRVLEGNPRIYARIEFNQGGKAAGLFKATTGKIEVTFPFTEHATILEGQVTLTDATGRSHTYKPGESYFIQQGQVVIWEVKHEHVIKSFFNIFEPG